MSSGSSRRVAPRVVPSAVHGGLDVEELARLGIDPDQVLDFSTNVNPFGPTDAVRRAIVSAAPDRYPDRDCHRLRARLAERHGRPAAEIVAGNGAAELIHLVAAACLRQGDRVLILRPAFEEYERAARLAGATVDACWTVGGTAGDAAHAADPLDPATIDRVVSERLGTLRPRIAFVANPANPTGDELPADVLAGWAARSPNTLFVIDEAYAPFTDDRTSLAGARLPNLLVLRSMTKDAAIAGVRLGYAVGPEEVIDAVAARRPPWNVSAPAQAAGLAALADPAGSRPALERLRGEHRFLAEGLAAIGLAPRPSGTPFFLLDVGDAAVVRASLLHEGIQVRDCASFGLSRHVRISPRRREDNERLLAAMALQVAPGAASAVGAGDDRPRALYRARHVDQRRAGYPMVLIGLDRRTAAVVGGGPVAARKVRGLLAAGARVQVVAPDAVDDLRALADEGRITWDRRPYRPGDLDGAALAFAATNVREVNRRVADDARREGIPCNVADAPAEGTFIVPAVHRGGDLLVAVSTGGSSPGRAAAVRDRLATILDAEASR